MVVSPVVRRLVLKHRPQKGTDTLQHGTRPKGGPELRGAMHLAATSTSKRTDWLHKPRYSRANGPRHNLQT